MITSSKWAGISPKQSLLPAPKARNIPAQAIAVCYETPLVFGWGRATLFSICTCFRSFGFFVEFRCFGLRWPERLRVFGNRVR